MTNACCTIMGDQFHGIQALYVHHSEALAISILRLEHPLFRIVMGGGGIEYHHRMEWFDLVDSLQQRSL